MRRLLDQLAGRGAGPWDVPVAPERPIAVIGDVHGCDDLLARMLDWLGREAPDHRPVLVGDLIDRGEDSAGVLRRVMGRSEVVAIKGNHEAMCLAFLDQPEAQGPQWLRNGGLQTLASFGVRLPGADPEEIREAALRLRAAMGDAMVAWLRDRPLWWRSGNVAAVHAGADPRRPLEEQEEEVLLWQRPHRGERARTDGVWIVHGHTIVDEPEVQGGRVNVDTGAFATGVLTALLMAPGAARFVQT